jgi:hypothetical protein
MLVFVSPRGKWPGERGETGVRRGFASGSIWARDGVVGVKEFDLGGSGSGG